MCACFFCAAWFYTVRCVRQFCATWLSTLVWHHYSAVAAGSPLNNCRNPSVGGPLYMYKHSAVGGPLYTYKHSAVGGPLNSQETAKSRVSVSYAQQAACLTSGFKERDQQSRNRHPSCTFATSQTSATTSQADALRAHAPRIADSIAASSSTSIPSMKMTSPA